jgi:hypothetical protein
MTGFDELVDRVREHYLEQFHDFVERKRRTAPQAWQR